MTEKGARADINVDAVFDLETEDWTTFVVGGLYLADGTYRHFDWRREDALFDALISLEVDGRPAEVWSHNGGAFDIKWALDHALRKNIKCDAVAAGSRIVTARIGDVIFRDSKALTKISLEELTYGAGVSKEKLGLTCVGPEGGCREEAGECKGYCAIHRRMPRAQFRRLLSYLEADCRSLFGAMQRVREYATENDLDLGVSVGAAAWKNARRLLELLPASLSWADHKFMRRAYYGGRVQLGKHIAPRGYEYDVNSMYPACLAQCPVPVGEPSHVLGEVAGRLFRGGTPGCYRARVRVPQMHLPPLPYRIQGRSTYPTGEFEGVWTAPELQYAAQVGVEIVAVTEALVWRQQAVVFTPWVEKLFKLRHAAIGWDGKPDKNSPIGMFLKYYANSLTGKFGSSPEGEKVVIGAEDEAIVVCCQGASPATGPDACQCKGRCRAPKLPKCLCGAWNRLDNFGLIHSVPQHRIMPCAHIEWAAYLTSQARVEWHKQAVSENSGEDFVYGDTDSLFTLHPRTRNIGPSLGQWKDCGEWEDFRGIAPKNYSVRHAGELKVKAKGFRLPKNPDKAKRLLESGQAFGKDAVIGFKAGARKGKFFQKDATRRKCRKGYGDRIPDGDSTRAPTIQEVMRRFA